MHKSRTLILYSCPGDAIIVFIQIRSTTSQSPELNLLQYSLYVYDARDLSN